MAKDRAAPFSKKHRRTWIPVTGGMILIGVINLIGRWSQPWTHTFALVLVIWPVLPLAALWAWRIEVK